MRNCLFDSGVHLDIAAMPYAVSAGQGVLVGSLFGFAFNDYLISTPGIVVRKGVFTHAKDTGSGTDFAVGAAVYWNPTTRKITGADDSVDPLDSEATITHTLIGRGFAAAAVGDAVASVVLVPQ